MGGREPVLIDDLQHNPPEGRTSGSPLQQESAGLAEMLPGVPVTHPNLLSPTFMEYRCSPRLIRSLGPCGSFSYDGRRSMESPFRELPLLSLSL